MSLLIKALDKAQEQAQAAKNKKEVDSASTHQDAASSQKKAAKTAKPTRRAATPTSDQQDHDADALSFEVTRPSVDLALAESVASASTYSNQDLSLSLLEETQEVVKKDASASAPATAFDNKTANTDIKLSATNSATNAANVFSAKRVEATNQNAKLAFLAATALIVLFAIGGYFYWQLYMQPVQMLPARPLPSPIATADTAVMQNEVPQNLESTDMNPGAATEDTAPVASTANAETEEPAQASQELLIQEEDKQKTARLEQSFSKNKQLAAAPERVFVDDEVARTPNSKAESRQAKVQTQQIASDSATIQVTKSHTQTEINPAVMRAYEAYNAGNDAEAQKLYKQVLQRDVRNVDALLGLGAIATRQGRTADANGWYGKVLELEPRNAIAQAALINHPESANDSQQADQESRIKSMLAKQPDDANLHAALGQYYADKNQWSSAQQAYFDAYRLNPSADNAFNLAVSLDQMRKPKLALPYYQRALEQADGASNIDKIALQARISAIQ
jgi:cytochrome c-type biogenesis protein CcmH/NrfG